MVAEKKDEGYVQKYPCFCGEHSDGICWIVRHPDAEPPISYPTELEALQALEELRARA
jgi:hypothetical protein